MVKSSRLMQAESMEAGKSSRDNDRDRLTSELAADGASVAAAAPTIRIWHGGRVVHLCRTRFQLDPLYPF